MKKRDDLQKLKNIVMRFIGDIYGLSEVSIDDDSLTIHFTECEICERLKKNGVNDIVDACGAHERYWKVITESIDPSINFRITKGMQRGDSHCEFLWD